MSASYEAIFPSLRTVPPAYPPPPEWQSAAPAGSAAASGDDDFGHDLLEIVNPLQHIPLVSTIYRQLTGDKIGPMERIAGDALYGGLLGLVSSVANVAFEQVTGKDFGDTALAMLGIGNDKQTAVAANNSSAPQPAAPRVASAPPAQLIPVAASAGTQTQVPTGAAMVDGANGFLMNSLNRNGIGLDLGSQSSSLVTVSAFDDKNVNSLLTSLNRNGIGLDLGPAASTAPSAPPPTAATDSGTPGDNNANALMASLDRDGVGTDVSLRAMYAYRKSLDLPTSPANADAAQH